MTAKKDQAGQRSAFSRGKVSLEISPIVFHGRVSRMRIKGSAAEKERCHRGMPTILRSVRTRRR